MDGTNNRDLGKGNQEIVGDQRPIERYRLISIGIAGAYNGPRWRPLQAAVSDAQKVSRILVENYGFEVEAELYEKRATRDAIIDALTHYMETSRETDALVIYYAGHGHIAERLGKGYWIPYIPNDEHETDRPSAWVSNSDIKDLVAAMRSRHILLLSDSCFSGDFLRPERRVSPVITEAYVKRAYGRRARQVITSGGLEPVVDISRDGMSPFADWLCRTLREHQEPYVTASGLFDRIKGGVTEDTQQLPQEGRLQGAGGENEGQMVLLRSGGTDLAGLIAEREKRLTELQKAEAEQREAERARKQEEEAWEAELAEMDARIADLEKSLSRGGTAGSTLREIYEAVKEKERQEEALIAAKKRQAEEARKRREHIAALKREELARKQAELAAELAIFKEVEASEQATPANREAAWEGLCQVFGVKGVPYRKGVSLHLDSLEEGVVVDLGSVKARPFARQSGGASQEEKRRQNSTFLISKRFWIGVFWIGVVLLGIALEWMGSRLGSEVEPTPKPEGMHEVEVTVEAPVQEGQDLNLLLGSDQSLTMKWIPPGTFLMGGPANEGDRSGDETQHEVTLTKGIWLGQFEVTQGQWQAMMGNNPSYFKGSGLGAPVENVSWEDAVTFCRKLTKLLGKSGGLPPGYELTLPTEAQWEYACRGGTTTAFYFGDSLSGGQANFDGNYPYGGGRKGEYLRKTVKVGSYAPNAWGLHDMHGNVWEWCQDRYGDYSKGAVIDPTGPGGGQDRALRGGSWISNARNCRSAVRDGIDPSSRNYYIGFRLSLQVQNR